MAMALRELVHLLFVVCSLAVAGSARAIAAAGMNTKFIEKLDESYSQKPSIKIAVTGVPSLDAIMGSCGYDVSYSSDDSFVKIFESRPDAVASTVVAACVIDNCEEPGADLALLRVEESDFLNEDSVLQRVQNALRSLGPSSGSEEEQKRVLVLLFPAELTGPRLVEHQQRLGALLQAAWSTHQADRVGADVVQLIDNELDIVMIPDSDNAQIRVVLSRAFDSSSIKSITTLFADNSNVDRLGMQLMLRPLKSGSARGIDKCKQSGSAALDLAEAAAKAEGEKLKAKLPGPAQFASFVNNLLAKTLEVFRADIADGASSAVVDLAEAELRRDVYDLMFPYFRAQVQLARQDVISKFNDIAVDEIEISPDMIQVLRGTQRDSVNSFRHFLRQLLPRGAPNSWGAEYDVQQLGVLLSDYIDGREVQARLQGVLPRGRKPIDFSVHYFINHPLGRDYRQDVLGKSSDVPLFDAGLSQEEPPIVPAARARAGLARALQNGRSIGVLERMAASRDSEFAREMMMFPLSVKNPAVPLMSGRSGRRKAGPPKKDDARERTGPERFIRYDISPMDQVKEDMQEALRSGPAEEGGGVAGGEGALQRALRGLPLAGQSYKHPRFNYGKKYSAKSSSK